MNREERIAAGRIKHGVGADEYLPGNVSHLVSPIVGSLRRLEHDGESPSQDDVRHMIDRLSLVLDLVREKADKDISQEIVEVLK